jgi:hypothetical protein
MLNFVYFFLNLARHKMKISSRKINYSSILQTICNIPRVVCVQI